MSRILVLVAVLAIGFQAELTHSQDVANGLATATVLAGLSVTAIQNLQFGNVFQGIAKSMVKNDDDSSGIFGIAGVPSAGLSVYLTLPDYLALPNGSDRLNIAFSNTDANVDSTTVTPATFAPADGWADQNPRNLPITLRIGAGGATRIYLGGRVTPSVNQSAGNYAGDIICSVAYTGT
ncbi:MAG: hypothetical protein AB1644_08225 [Candidatus Zixiibacteriota bacterium]